MCSVIGCPVLLKHVAIISMLSSRGQKNLRCYIAITLTELWSNYFTSAKSSHDGDLLWIQCSPKSNMWMLGFQIRLFCILTYPFQWKCVSSLKIILLVKSAFILCLVERPIFINTQLIKMRRGAWSFALGSWSNDDLYWCRWRIFFDTLCKLLLEMASCYERRRINVVGTSNY